MRHLILIAALGLPACLESGTRPGATADAPGADAAMMDAHALDAAEASPPPPACLCEAVPEAIEGTLYVTSTVSEGRPFTFRAALTSFDDRRVVLDVQPLADGQIVGERVEVEGVLFDGAVDVRIDNVVIPAEANPIADVELTINLRLRGCISSAMEAMCGEAEGNIKRPTVMYLERVRWGLSRGDAAPGSCACE